MTAATVKFAGGVTIADPVAEQTGQRCEIAELEVSSAQ